MTDTTPKQNLLHESVMLQEVCEYLELGKKKNVIDATLGLGGHAGAILEKLPKTGKLIGFDADPEHIKIARKNLKAAGERVLLVNTNFANMEEELKKTRIKAIDAILFDLGMASPHVDNPEKGFSFLREGPLDMRYNPAQSVTAADVVNKYSERELIRIFKEYGEEKKARKIAMEIVKSRKHKPFKTTTQLADFIEKHLHRQGRIHPATRVFQALRIEVNQELDVLASALQQAFNLVKPGGRIAVISYHSLEDRIVKHFFKSLARDPNTEPVLKLITKKPLMPTDEEVGRNPRSRSAKLRVAEKL